MRRSGSIGRIIVLLILIVLLVFGGLLWFDYLGLINTRGMFSPLYSLFGLKTPQGITPLSGDELANLDDDRYEKRLKAEQIANKQVAEELDARQSAVEEKEKNFNLILTETNDRNANIIQIATYMNSMPPDKAVANLLEMDDQDIIDVFRAVEKIAAENNRLSQVSNWFSLMPPARAAEIQRKMANKPATLP